MERRSWPWKKKSSSKQSSEATFLSADSTSVPHSGNASPVHRTSRRDEHAAMLKSYAEQLQDASQRNQQAEEKIKALSSKLAAAQKEITEKESLVKQHAKVAEDAVSGWEKAENETASVKQELELVLEQKSEAEEQIVYLNETLKENQERAKAELERKIQELTSRKNKECERMRSELEARLSELGQRLLESTAECKVLGTSLQERMRKISELNDARSKAEAEIGVLNARLDSKDKEIMGLRYEVQVLNKELQIRNEEKEYCKREADVAHRQQLEGVKKVQVLEAECQRLRTLVRRKLPGPGAVAQMKQEVDSWGRDERRRSLGSKAERGSKDFQIQLLTERVLSMEEETKMLREVLAQRNCELQSVTPTKGMYSEPAASVRGTTPSKPRNAGSECSFADEAASSCADAWSSAITELDQFRKEKVGSSSSVLVADSKFQMMDDFAEMEQLASKKQENRAETAELEKAVADKEQELNSANRLCVEISSKLIATEKELSALKEKNSANEVSLIKLQEKLDSMLERQSEEGDASTITDKHKTGVPTTEALSANVQKVICLVEALAHALGIVDHDDSSSSAPSPSTSEMSSSENSQMSSSGLEKLTTASNKLAEGKAVDFTEFVGELSAVLNAMTVSISGDNGVTKKEVFESEATTKLQKENSLLHAEVAKLRHELNRLKTEKEMLHQSCEKSKEKIQELECQLAEAESMVADLKAKHSSSQAEIESSRAEFQERLRNSDATVTTLREKLAKVEEQYEAERDQHQGLVTKYQEIEAQLNGKHGDASNHSNNGEDIALKLAECQRTILALGKQLKVLSSPRGLPEATSHSRVNSASSSMDHKVSSIDDDIADSDTNRTSDFTWSSVRLEQQQNSDHHRHVLPWSPPRKLDRSSSEQCDTTWLYSPDRKGAGAGAAGHQYQQQQHMRSPARFFSSANRMNNISEQQHIDMSKSINMPLTPSKNSNNGSSFGRFFSRGRNAA